MEKIEKIKRIFVIAFLAVFLALCALLLKAYFDGHFDSVETLQIYIDQFGFWAPLVLTVIQAVQVVLPVLPGFLGCIVGAILFGAAGGFWCNYIGISLGSLIAFLLARRYGQGLVNKMFKGKRYQKLMTWAAESRSYAVMLFVATLLPLFPDDFLCYFSGITNMTFKKFTTIIVLGKPWCILAYSICTPLILEYLSYAVSF